MSFNQKLAKLATKLLSGNSGKVLSVNSSGEADLSEGFIYKGPLGANLNLNDVLTPGYYYQSANANTVAPASNYPVQKAGILEVFNPDGNSSIRCQRYHVYPDGTSTGNVIYIRGYYSGTWSAWRKVGDTSTLADAAYDNEVSKMLRWKHFGSGYVIFDASNSTAPNGAAINNVNPAGVWTANYPTLMGWNGSSTYGVRVDSARISDTVAGFEFYNSGNGYQKLPGGLMIQWGSNGNYTQNSSVNRTFPFAFPNACHHVFITNMGSISWATNSAWNITAAGFTEGSGNNNQSGGTRFLAIGY